MNADGITVPVVTTSGAYKYVGKLVLAFDKEGNVKDVLEESGPVIVQNTTSPDPFVNTQAVSPISEYLAVLDKQVIGTTEIGLDDIWGNIRTTETNLGNLVADAFLWQATKLVDGLDIATPDIALANGGGIHNNDICAEGGSAITLLDTFDILPFANFLTIIPDIPHGQFKEIMENAMSNVENVDRRFAQISGFTIEYDLTTTAQELDIEDKSVITDGSRVVSVILNDGTPIIENGSVVEGDSLNIAIVDFLARGGDDYPFHGALFTVLGVSYQQALENYIVSGLENLVVTADEYPEGGEARTYWRTLSLVPQSVET